MLPVVQLANFITDCLVYGDAFRGIDLHYEHKPASDALSIVICMLFSSFAFRYDYRANLLLI